MPQSPALVVERDDGTERGRLSAVTASVTKSLIEVWRGQVAVDRSEWLALSTDVDEVADRFIIERGDGSTAFAGRFNDDTRDGNNVIVELLSYEKDAQDAEPITGKKLYNNQPDSDVFTDALSNVPTLLAGTVETGDSAVSLSFGQSTWAKVIRDAAEPAGQDVRYNTDRTVDFLDRLGSDKPNVAISSTDQNIVNELGVETDNQNPATHVRVLGATQGDTRPVADAVVGSYSGGRKVWRTYSNKDIIQQSRAQTIADRLADGLNNEPRRILVNAELTQAVDVDIGDRIQVTLPQHDIDRLLRVAEWTERIGPDPVYQVELTNRYAERGGSRQRRDDLARFNDGYEGFVDRDNFRAIERQPVESGVDAVGEYRYPDDVETEVQATVTVRGLAYRGYTRGAASGGGQHSHTVPINVTSQNSATSELENDTAAGYNNISQAFATENVPTTGTGNRIFATLFVDGAASINRIRLFDDTESEELWDIPIEGGPNSIHIKFPVDSTFTDRQGNTLEANVFFAASNSGDLNLAVSVEDEHVHIVDETETTDDATPLHTHDPQAGVVEFPTETPSNCDLLINGSTVASNIGSGTFTETVDVSGEFVAGVNDISVTSDTTGFISAYVNSELFRRGEP
jgi:hypothetical protein